MKLNSIKIIDNLRDFISLKDDWELIYSTQSYHIFQSFSFNLAAWKFLAAESDKNLLNLLVITLENKTLAILPLYLDSNKDLRFIGDTHSDFCDIITSKNIIFQQVYDFLKKHVNFRSISFLNLLPTSRAYQILSAFRSKYKIKLNIAEYSTLSLEKGEFPYNVSHYKSRQKHRINKASRKHNFKKYVLLSSKNSLFPFEKISLLRDRMIRNNIRKKNFLNNNFLMMLKQLYESDLIVLGCLKNDDDYYVAINIILKTKDGELLFWIDLFNEEQMINITNYIRFLKSISKNKSIKINFGRGRYFYKYSNFAPFFDKLYSINIFSNFFRYKIFLISYFTKQKLVLMYKKIKS